MCRFRAVGGGGAEVDRSHPGDRQFRQSRPVRDGRPVNVVKAFNSLKLPHYDKMVVVEGPRDRRAVLQAVRAKVFVLHSASRALAPQTTPTWTALRAAADTATGVTVLMDPDVAGRQARNAVNSALAGCWHAFIPTLHCTATAADRFHDEGNVGVEHAHPAAILAALRIARRSDVGRQVFTRADLEALGLVSPGIGPVAGRAARVPKSRGAVARRAALCDALGLGMCDGKQLLKQLNLYGFTRDDVHAVLSAHPPASAP